jgi:hypothetical protein
MERLLWALALIAVSCSGNSGGGKTDPCEDQTCSDHGECLVNSEGQPVCDCDPGYDDVALTCVANCFGRRAALRVRPGL